ncbi:MupA/Atu3671 family FMN-dependent luciferase-like monooxygenase [Haliangium sp.]|uniref:MupA/Atu3671 family FMN-dependent luciferase-like monooxygenase n=1 Tax=Haliangium sp. TaxID=2663208 RepID=UPI003D130DD4
MTLSDTTKSESEAPAGNLRGVRERLRGVLETFMEMPAGTLDLHTPLLELGADSLVLIDLIRVLKDDYGVGVSMQRVFEELNTVSLLSEYVTQTMPAPVDAAPITGPTDSPPASTAPTPTILASRPTPPPVAPAQPAAPTPPVAPAPPTASTPQPPPSRPASMPTRASAPLGASAAVVELLAQNTRFLTDLAAQQQQTLQRALALLGGDPGATAAPTPSSMGQAQAPPDQPASAGATVSATSAVVEVDAPAHRGPAKVMPPGGWSKPKQRLAAPDPGHILPRTQVGLSLYYFGNYPAPYRPDKYRLVLEGARFADRHGFEAVWVPERHFHPFAGFSPNPSVLAAALARETQRVRLRAGSVVAPLHHPVRIAEEWAVVDNLSGGRVGIAFASGWHPDDFVFAPEVYGRHREVMFEHIDAVARLWQGQPYECLGGAGNRLRPALYPMPKQPRLPIWLSVVNNPDTFIRAGRLGYNVITNLIGQSRSDLADNLARYYQARREGGHDPATARVTLMLHTFVGSDATTARAQARGPFIEYLKSSAGLLDNMFRSQGMDIDTERLSPADMDYLLGQSFDRYVRNNALIGDAESCAGMVRGFMDLGVSEIACFIDFGVDDEQVLRGLEHLRDVDTRLRSAPATETAQRVPEPEQRTPGLLQGSGGAPLRLDGLDDRQRAHLRALVDRLSQKTARSKQAAQALRPQLADYRGILGFRLSLKELLYLIVADRLEGAHVWDIDGNRYVDLTMGFGITLFGHNPDFIRAAVQAQLERGIELGLRAPRLMDLVPRLCAFLGVDRVAFANTGTEAMMGAIRLARLATGKAKLVIFEGAYHGHSDAVLARRSRVPGDPQSLPISPGISLKAMEEVMVLEYGKPAALELIRAHAGEIAAVITEPVQARRPGLQPVAFLRELRELTQHHDIALVFDEIITGFRVHPRGAGGLFAIQPDLSTFGKIIGGGLPIGLIAGSARFMDGLDGGLWQYGDDSHPNAETTMYGGTFQMHSLALAAADATLRRLEDAGPALQQQLSARCAALTERLDACFRAREVPIETVRFGSLFRFQFARHVNAELFFHHLVDQGVFIKDIRNCFVSTAHGDDDLDAVVRAVDATVLAMQEGGFLPAPVGGPLDPPREPSTSIDTPLVLAASPAQEQLFVVSRHTPRAVSAYIEPIALELRGPLSEPALEQALATLVARHESLRLVARPGHREIELLPRVPVTLARVDLPHLDVAAPDPDRDPAHMEFDPRIVAWVNERAEQAMDLHRGPLFDFSLLRLGPERALLVLRFHHSVADGMSFLLLVTELARAYSAHLHGDQASFEPATSFQALAPHLDAYLASSSSAEDRRFWRRYLGRELPVVTAPGDRTPPTAFSFHGNRHAVRLDGATRRALIALGGRHRATLFTVLLGVYALLVQRLADVDEVVVATPVSGRLPGTEAVVGYATHLVPIIARREAGQSFSDYLRALSADVLAVLEHRRLPFYELMREGLLGRPNSSGVLLPLLFNLDRVTTVPEFEGLEAELAVLPRACARADLELNVLDTGDALTLLFDGASDRYSPSQLERYARAFVGLCRGLIDHPDMDVARAPLMSDRERERVLVSFQNHDPVPAPRCLHELIAAADAAPTDPALVDPERNLSYGELGAISNRLAHHLGSFGIGRDAVVAVYLPSSVDAFSAILAVSKAGAAFLPLRVGDPRERISAQLRLAGARLVISRAPWIDDLRGLDTETLDLATWTPEAYPDTPPEVRADPDALAYVLFTSGSTGQPKAVALTHRGLAPLCHEMRTRLRLSRNDRVYALVALSFDVSLLEMLIALTSGAALHCHGRAEPPLGRALSQELTHHRITCLVATPSLWATVPKQELDTVEQLVIGAEAVPAELLVPWKPGVKIHHLYGPTETTIWSLGTSEPAPGDLSFARTAVGTRLYILDRNLEPMPIDVPGQLYIAGEGLARGYLGQPELTQARFVPDPFAERPGARMYATGDLGCYTETGAVRFLGRMDTQVKLRGFRIELGEIEAAMTRQPGVREARVWLQPHGAGGRLVAVYTSEDNSQVAPEDLRRALARTLPDYMLPSLMVAMASLPLTSHHKLDLAAVERVLANHEGQPRQAPQGAVEETLATMWRALLSGDAISREDDFFAVGGDSLRAARLIDEINATLGCDLPMQAIYENPTLAALAARIEAGPGADRDDAYLHATVLPEDVRPMVAPRSPAPTQRILLTGATGFLGAHLLADLVDTFPDAELHCLARDGAGHTAADRVHAALRMHGLCGRASDARVHTLCGDLAAPELGLDRATWTRLCDQIDLIVHNGATIHHVSGYRALEAINVGSTVELLRLAAHGRPKRLAYVSTLSVVMESESVPDGEEFLREAADLESGYVQSKWVSERLLAQAHDLGLLVSIFRPGLIAGHSRTGYGPFANDHFLSLVGACLDLGRAPALDLTLDILPVDVVSHTIASALDASDGDGAVYNLTADPRFTWRRLVTWLDRHVSAVSLVDATEWETEHLPRLGPDSLLSPLRGLYRGGYLSRIARWQPVTTYENTRSVWSAQGAAPPHVTDAYLAVWFGALCRAGFPRRPDEASRMAR